MAAPAPLQPEERGVAGAAPPQDERARRDVATFSQEALRLLLAEQRARAAAPT